MREELMELARYRLKRGKEARRDALILFEKKSYASTINRAYYAIFYAARALLATRQVDSSKHSGVIALFNQHFVKSGLVPKELSRIIHTIFEKRTEGDYEDFREFSKKETEEILTKSKLFLDGIEKVLDDVLSR